MKAESLKICGIIIIVLIIVVFSTCQKDDSSDLTIAKGVWSGTDISFTVEGSPLKNN